MRHAALQTQKTAKAYCNIKVSQNSTQYINPMDINLNYSEGDTPIALKSDFTTITFSMWI